MKDEHNSEQDIVDVHSLEKATDIQFEADKRNYENGVRSTFNKKFKSKKAESEKESRDEERKSLADYGKFYKEAQSLEGFFKTLIGNFIKSIKLGFQYDQHDKDLYTTSAEHFLKAGNDDAQYEDNKINYNLGNLHNENVARDVNQGTTNDFSNPIINPEKIKTAKQAVAITDSLGSSEEILNKQNSYKNSISPKEGNLFLVSDKRIPLYQKSNGFYTLNKTPDAKIISHSKLFPGTNKYVVEVPKEIAEHVISLNKENATGIMVCDNLDKICSDSIRNNASFIKDYQKDKIIKKQKEHQKANVAAIKNPETIKKSSGRKR